MGGRTALLLGPRVSSPANVARTVFHYDATADANLIFGTGTNIATLIDLSGNGRTASQSNDGLRANRVTSVINGQSAATFGTNDSYLVDNALSAYRNVAAIGFWGVLLKSA